MGSAHSTLGYEFSYVNTCKALTKMIGHIRIKQGNSYEFERSFGLSWLRIDYDSRCFRTSKATCQLEENSVLQCPLISSLVCQSVN